MPFNLECWNLFPLFSENAPAVSSFTPPTNLSAVAFLAILFIKLFLLPDRLRNRLIHNPLVPGSAWNATVRGSRLAPEPMALATGSSMGSVFTERIIFFNPFRFAIPP